MISETASTSRRTVDRPAALHKNEIADLKYGAAFRTRIIHGEDHSAVLFLLGELDVTSIAQFESAVAEVVSGKPKELVFDLTHCEFVSAQGYAAMGRCSLNVPVKVRSRTGVAARVFAVFGFEHVEVVKVQDLAGDVPWTPDR